MKRNKKNSAGFAERCAGELIGRMSIIEIHSNYEMMISGCRGIVEYTDSVIVADTLSGVVKITGECFCIKVFREDLLNISGKIISVSFGDNIC